MDDTNQGMQTFEALCIEYRIAVKDIAAKVKKMRHSSAFDGEQQHFDQHSEAKANIMLTYRHLEDAAMRLGKVIQAWDGGVSCYDQNPKRSGEGKPSVFEEREEHPKPQN